MGFYSIDYGYRKDRRWRLKITIILVVLAFAALGYIRLHQPESSATLSSAATAQAVTPSQPKITTLPMPWPAYGQSAYGVAGSGVLATSDDSQPVPVASLAKVITALAVLKKKPLSQGEQGPMITLTDADIKIYEQYVAKSGAVVPIEVGEQISQYQALQAMLMPSANNISDSLVRWAFGSVEEYNAYANKMLQEMGLSNTIVSDASGFSPATKSTAHNMVQLGISYMQNPVLQEIAKQKEARVPFAGLIRNYNSLANEDGIIGLKVGNTDEAKRCFLVADTKADGRNSVSVVAVIGAEDLETAMRDAKKVLVSGNNGYKQLNFGQ